MAFRIATAAAHIGEDGVVDAVVVAPTAHCVIASVAFDVAVLGAHFQRLEGERFGQDGLRNDEIRILKQGAAGAEDELFGKWGGVNSGAEIDPEILDDWLRFGIHNRAVQRERGDVHVGFHLQGRELQGVFIVDETVFGNGIWRQAFGDVIVELQQFTQGVSVL